MSQSQPPFQQPPQPPYAESRLYQQSPPIGYPQSQQPQTPRISPTPLPQVPPRKPKRSVPGWLYLLVGLIIGAVLGYAIHTTPSSSGSSTHQATSQATIAVTSTTVPTQAPTPTPVPAEKPTQTPTPNPHGDIGVTQTTDLWAITVNSIGTSTGTDIDTPKAGNIYVIVNITAQNNDTSNRLIASTFKLLDNQGSSFDTTIISDPHIFVGGNVVAGQKLRGDLVYEIPKSLHSFTLQFDPNFDPSLTVQWNLSD